MRCGLSSIRAYVVVSPVGLSLSASFRSKAAFAESHPGRCGGLFFFFFFCFLGSHRQHMEVPRLGVLSQSCAAGYTIATAVQDL